MKTITIIASLMLLQALSACNTMEGLGQDLQAGGKSLEKAADRNKK